MKKLYRSFSVQIIFSILGAFILLVFCTAYIVYSNRKIQELSESYFEQERFLVSVKQDVAAFEAPLLEFLSTRSSNALSLVFSNIQSLRQKLPIYQQIRENPEDLKERVLYSLIFQYLNPS